METDLLEDNKYDEKKISDIFVILSVSSWIILLITSWMTILTLGLSDGKIFSYFWLFTKIKEEDNYYEYFTFFLDINFYIFSFIIFITLVITTLGFLILIYSLYKRKEKVINAMFGPYSKFHFIPLLFIAVLFIIGETNISSNDYVGYNIIDAKYISSLIFTCLAIICLVTISLTTKITSPWYATLTINKGAFSCFFALLIYNFGFLVSNYVFIKKYIKKYKDGTNFFKKINLAFVIVIGILNNAASVLLQDFMIALMNLLIYLGMTINFYKTNKELREESLYKSMGIFDILMMALSFLCIVFHIIRFKGIIPD